MAVNAEGIPACSCLVPEVEGKSNEHKVTKKGSEAITKTGAAVVGRSNVGCSAIPGMPPTHMSIEVYFHAHGFCSIHEGSAKPFCKHQCLSIDQSVEKHLLHFCCPGTPSGNKLVPVVFIPLHFFDQYQCTFVCRTITLQSETIIRQLAIYPGIKTTSNLKVYELYGRQQSFRTGTYSSCSQSHGLTRYLFAFSWE